MSERLSFSIPVEYGDLPDFQEIWKHPEYGPRDSQYVVHDCCRGISLVPRELEMEVVDLGLMSGTDCLERVILELDALGLRPIIYPELISFRRKYPDNPHVRSDVHLWNHYDLAAAGSYVLRTGTMWFPKYACDPDSGWTYLGWTGGNFGYREQSKVVYDHFLAVKK